MNNDTQLTVTDIAAVKHRNNESDRNIDRDCDSHKDVTVIRKLQADSD